MWYWNTSFILSAFHSVGGPLTVTEGSHQELTSMMQTGAAYLGHRPTDCNGKDNIGIFFIWFRRYEIKLKSNIIKNSKLEDEDRALETFSYNTTTKNKSSRNHQTNVLIETL